MANEQDTQAGREGNVESRPQETEKEDSNDDASSPSEQTQPQVHSNQEEGPAVPSEEGVASPNDYPSGLRFWLAVTALCLGIFLSTLDSTVIATATPYITDEFHSLGDVGWYASIYPMAIAMSQLTYGKLSARYPIRWIYTAAVFFFLVGSAVSASAPNSSALIAGRAIAGLGSSGILVGAFSLVPFIAPPAKRPIFLALIGAARGVAATCGPLIGGALTERVSWRWNFYINLPLCVTIYIVFLFSVRPPRRQMDGFTSWADLLQTLDLIGLTVLAGSVVCLLLTLQWGGIQYPWGNARIIALLVLFGALGLAFVAIEIKQGSKAMLPARVFTQRSVLCATFFAFCTAGAAFVLTYYLPLWFQGAKGFSPIKSGVSTLPWVITSTITALVGGGLISKLGYADGFMVLATIFGCVGSGLFTTFTADTSTGKWIGYQMIYAVGSSLSSLTPILIAQNALPLHDVPIGSSMVMFFQTIGVAVFVSIAQALFTNNLTAELETLGIAGFDPSKVNSAGLTILTQGLSEGAKDAVLRAISDALTQAWLLPVILSCLSIVGALGVEHRKLRKRDAA